MAAMPKPLRKPGNQERNDVSFPAFLHSLFSCSLFLLSLFPNGTIPFLIKRRTAGRELPQLVMLGAHERGAITESAAHTFAVQSAMFHQLAGEVRLRQRGPADADQRDLTIPNVGRARLK